MKAERMEEAVRFVSANPGVTMSAVTQHVLSTFDEARREKPTAYKQAAMVVERIIKDRHVRQAPAHRLYAWDAKRKLYAEALERAAFAAPDPDKFGVTMGMACAAWREAGDENRARVLEKIAFERADKPR